MSDNTIPEYLQPALAQLEKARAAHLENARLMDETVTAIERVPDIVVGDVKALHCQEHRGVCLRKSPSVFMCARIRAVVWCLKRFRPSTASLSARSRRTNWQNACMKNRNCRQYG